MENVISPKNNVFKFNLVKILKWQAKLKSQKPHYNTQNVAKQVNEN